MAANAPNPDMRTTVAAARLNHFQNLQGPGVTENENVLQGPVSDPETLTRSSIEDRVTTVVETVSAMFDEVNAIREIVSSSDMQDLAETMRAGFESVREQMNSLKATVDNLVESNGKGGQVPSNVQPSDNKVVEENPPQPDNDWEYNYLKDTGDDEKQREERKDAAKTCGVCHIKCSKQIMVLIPCEHYPYCAPCVQKLSKKRDDMPLFIRPDGWDDAKLFCPTCQEPCPSATALKKLRPYVDDVAEIN